MTNNADETDHKPSSDAIMKKSPITEESGHTQNVREIRLDCDGDVVLLKIEQVENISNSWSIQVTVVRTGT